MGPRAGRPQYQCAFGLSERDIYQWQAPAAGALTGYHACTLSARLIRSILHLSQRDIITLREELDLLKLYLDLEHRGCNGRFEYAVVVGENINVDAIKILPAWVFTPAHKPVPMK